MAASISVPSRYLVLAYAGGIESVAVKTTSPKKAHKVARSTARSGIVAVLHKHISDHGWKPVRRFEPDGSAA
jgi:hypothetical protein